MENIFHITILLLFLRPLKKKIVNIPKLNKQGRYYPSTDKLDNKQLEKNN